MKDNLNNSIRSEVIRNQSINNPNKSLGNSNADRLEELEFEREMVLRELDGHREFIMKLRSKENAKENLQCRLLLLEDIYAEYKTIHKEAVKLTDKTDEDAVNELSNKYYKFCNDFCLVRGLISSNITQDQAENTEGASLQITKLPPIPIPTFKGDVKEWISFRDTFEALVVNEKMNEVAKLHYLRESVKDGDAWLLISEIKPSEDAFAIAWATLKKRYDNKKIIIESHLQELFKLKSATNGTSTELRQLTENCDKQLRQLKAFGQPVEQWSTLINHMVKFRLDDESKLAWENECKDYDEMPTWSDLEEFLSKRSQVLEAFEAGRRRSNYKPRPTSS